MRKANQAPHHGANEAFGSDGEDSMSGATVDMLFFRVFCVFLDVKGRRTSMNVRNLSPHIYKVNIDVDFD